MASAIAKYSVERDSRPVYGENCSAR